MLFRAAASAAILAAAVNASAEPKPYRLASMPVLGMSLVRRDTNGYQPEQTACSDGDTCAEACGTGFQECHSTGDSIHCFNPEADQQCCTDGSGNSCEAGYYCTHDTSSQTWCCPDAMNLTECAAAYGIESLETPEPSTSAAPSTTSSAAPTTTAEPTTSEVPTTTEISTTELTTSAFNTTSTTQEETTSYVAPTSAGFTSAWTGANSTIASLEPTQPVEPAPTGPADTTSPGDGLGSGAATTGVSALLVLAAGVIAFL